MRAIAFRSSAICSAMALVGATAVSAQDSLQNGSTAVAQSGAAASALAGGTIAAGSVVVGSGVTVAGASAQAVGRSVAAAGSDVAQDARRAARFASGPLPVDRAVVVEPQDAPKVPYEAQTSASRPPGV